MYGVREISRFIFFSLRIFSCFSSICYKGHFPLWIYNNYWYLQFVFSLFFCLITWPRGLSIVLIFSFKKKLLALSFFLLLVFYFLDFCSLLFQFACFYSHTYSSFSGFLPWMFRPDFRLFFFTTNTRHQTCTLLCEEHFSRVLEIITFCFHHHSLQIISKFPLWFVLQSMGSLEVCSLISKYLGIFFPQASYCCLSLI